MSRKMSRKKKRKRLLLLSTQGQGAYNVLDHNKKYICILGRARRIRT